MGAEERPDRMTITDMRTGETMEFQYNPAEIEETLNAKYAKQEVVGGSYQPMQYVGTENLGISFELAFDPLSRKDAPDLMDQRAFLQSQMYSSSSKTTVANGDPPDSILVWPELYSLRTKILTYKGKGTRFNRKLKMNLYTVQLGLAEAPLSRITSEDVRLYGTIRNPTPTEFF